MPIIGREPPAEIVVPAPQVSARHAEIVHVEGDLYQITDLDSLNGTHVNGRRVQSARISLSDSVTLGSFAVDLRAFEHLIPRTAQPAPPRPQPRPKVAPEVAWEDPSPAPPRPEKVPPKAKPVRDRSGGTEEQAVAPDPARVRGYGQPGMGTELAVALAAQKSFTGKAFLTFFMYWLLWLPGFIMNLVFLSEAGRVRKITGELPPGTGCLHILLIFYVVLPLVAIVLLLATGGAILNSIFR